MFNRTAPPMLLLGAIVAFSLMGCKEDTVVNNITTIVSDPGIPRITWAGPRSVRITGYNVLMNGFRFAGYYSLAGKTVKSLATSDDIYAYDTLVAGFSLPRLNRTSPEMWVGVFAVAKPFDTVATIRFVPFLRVETYDRTTNRIIFASNVGEMTPEYFANTDLLVCEEGGTLNGTVVRIVTNTATSLTLERSTLLLTAGDYVLPAPGSGYEYKYLRTLKLENHTRSDNPDSTELRNFVFSEGRTYSYTGRWSSPSNPSGDITATDLPGQKLDFTDWVFPLATGLIGVGQAFITSTSGGSACLYLDHDGSNHVIASVCVDRTTAGQGFSSPFIVAFGRVQSLWARVNATDVVGRVVVHGWVED